MTTEQSPPAQATAAMAPYLMLAQRQLEANLLIASTWAAAMSAVSGSLLSHSPSAGMNPARSTVRTLGPVPASARSFRLINEPRNDVHAERLPTPYWTTNGSPTPSWPRFLNEPPTVQPDLFDEAIELLVDDDIKTAS